MEGEGVWNHEGDTLAPVSVGIAAIATFLTMFYVNPPIGSITKSKTRNAVTGTCMVTYFLLLSLFVFFEGDGGIGEVTDTLVTNFTFSMGVVIAFHFGTSTYEKLAAVHAVGQDPASENQVASAATTSETEGTTN